MTSLAPLRNIKTRISLPIYHTRSNNKGASKISDRNPTMTSSRQDSITVLDMSEIEQMSWEEFGSRKHSEMFENHFSIFDSRNFTREGKMYQWGQFITHLIMLFFCLAGLIWYCNSQM